MGKRFPWAAVVALCLLNVSAIAQHKTQHFCQQGHKTDALIKEHPELQKSIENKDQELESFTEAFVSKRSKRSSTYVIPVVFHVIHLNGPENISDAQVFDAVRIMNEDFNMENEDLADVVPSFQSIIGDADIEFRLAQLDPNGNPTSGIDRIVSNETNIGDDGSKLNPWPRNRYLNIWVVNQINGAPGAAAYAYLPGVAQFIPNVDGIIANHRYVGGIGTSSVSGMHTLSHEIGHVFNLRHPWGPSNDPGIPSNCNVDDGVSDTPNTIGTFGTCNTSQVSCGSLDNVQNLMDYASCDRMFTEGQVDRMHAALNSTVAQRNNLWKQANLLATGVGLLADANFKAVDPTICIGESVKFYDASKYDPTSISWEFIGGDISTSSNERPVVQYDLPGSFNVSLNAQQGSISKSISKNNFVMVRQPVGNTASVTESFESYVDIPNSNWYSFEVDNFENVGWELENTTGYSGSKSLKVNNFDAPEEQVFYVESNSFDLSVFSSARISFKHAYRRRPNSGGADRIRIEISNDCGNNWNVIYNTFGGAISSQNQSSPFTPSSSNDWKPDSTTIPSSYLVNDAVFRISFESQGGNNYYLDDINIRGGFKSTAQLKFPWNNATNIPIDVAFEWQPMPCTSYEFQYSDNQSMNNPVNIVQNFNGLAPSQASTYQTQLNSNQEYFWRVRLISNGTAQPWSETWKFTTGDFLNTNTQLEQNPEIVVFPNPANNQVTINVKTAHSEPTELLLFNSFGQLILSSKLSVGEQTHVIETRSLSNGIYILQVNGVSFSQAKQLVIHH